MVSSIGNHFRTLFEADNEIVHAIYDESQKVVDLILRNFTKPDWHRNYFSSIVKKESM
jgi:hypothetical protein